MLTYCVEFDSKVVDKLRKVKMIYTSDDTLVQPKMDNIIHIDNMLFRTLCNFIDTNLDIYVLDKVLKHNIFVASDVVTKEKDKLGIIRSESYFNVMTKYNQVINVVGIFEMYNVMMVQNELASRGIFITPSNREEKYIEIINTNDESLITLLEEYLEMKDRISPMLAYYNTLKEYKEKIYTMDNIENIQKYTEETLEFLN